MNTLLIFSLFHFCLAQVVHPNDKTIENVLEMAKKRPTFILFKSRKNHKNQNLMKIWEKLSSKYITDKKIVIADFSCQKYAFQCNSMNISYVPSIYTFYSPEFNIKYNGRYSFQVVDEWINKMSDVPVKNVTSIFEIFKDNENSTDSQSLESVKFIATKKKDYKEFYEIAYLRNSTNEFLFYNQKDFYDDEKDFELNNRITAFLNSNLIITSNNENISLSEFVWKNQFHVPFKLTNYNIKAAKNSKNYLAIYVTKFKKKNINYFEIKLNELNSILYKQLKLLGEKFYNSSNICWTDFRKFPIFFKSYGIYKAPALLVLKDDLFWMTKNVNIDHITFFMNQIIEGQIKGKKMSELKFIKYDFMRILIKYPMLIFLLLVLLISLSVIIYFLCVHTKRLRSFDRFEQELKRHPY